jgi:Cof subfamily protein (haloacid dehalogenase superfamily)
MSSSSTAAESCIYKLVALDLDGTTLNSSHRISDVTIEVLRKLSASGVTVCIATGRSLNSTVDYLTELKLPQTKIPLICFNGAVGLEYCTSSKAITPIFLSPVPEDITRQIIEFVEKRGHLLQYYNGSSGEVLCETPKSDEHRALLERYATLTGKAQTVIPSYKDVVPQFLPAKMLILSSLGADKLISEIKKEFESSPNGELKFNLIRGSPHPFFVEILAPSVSKGDGLKALVEKLNVPLESVLSFGDGENDIEMLRYAGCGVAMKNASAVTKSVANIVLERTNDEDGVAHHIIKTFNL